MTTIGESTSRLRNIIKAVKTDAFITDRFLYALLLKYGKALIRRQDSLNQLLKFSSLFVTLPCVELITINKVEACCGDIKSDCLFRRTKEKIPNVLEASFGPIFRRVSSIDGSIEIFPTSPGTYTSMTKTSTFKYNKRKYYWFLNGYLYFPDLTWESVMVDGVFESSPVSDSDCIQRQDQSMPIPDFLMAEAEQMALRDLGLTYQLPEDAKEDKENILR